MEQKQKEPHLGFGKGLRDHKHIQKRGKKMAGEEGNVLERRIIKEDLDEYRKALGDLYSGEVCFHCILQQLMCWSLAIIYDSMGGKRAKKMSKKWKEVEKECEKVASHFIDLTEFGGGGRKGKEEDKQDSEDNLMVQFRGFDGF